MPHGHLIDVSPMFICLEKYPFSFLDVVISPPSKCRTRYCLQKQCPLRTVTTETHTQALFSKICGPTAVLSTYPLNNLKHDEKRPCSGPE